MHNFLDIVLCISNYIMNIYLENSLMFLHLLSGRHCSLSVLVTLSFMVSKHEEKLLSLAFFNSTGAYSSNTA